MKIDCHTHIFPDDIALQAVKKLEKTANIQASGDGTVDGLLQSMGRTGIDAAIVMPVATHERQVEGINSWVCGVHKEHNCLIPFGAVFPGASNIGDTIRALAESGVRGVKIHPDYQLFSPDDEIVFPVYEACVKHDLAVMLHAGFDIGLSPPVMAPPRKIALVLERYPQLRLTASHMGGLLMWNDVNKYLAGKDVVFDTAASLEMMHPSVFQSIMGRHDTSKIVFGSDWPWLGQSRAVRLVDDLDFISGSAKAAIFGENARMLFRLSSTSEVRP